MTELPQPSYGGSTPFSFLILDTDAEHRSLEWLSPLLYMARREMEEVDLYKPILECLQIDRNAEHELEILALEYGAELAGMGYKGRSNETAQQIVTLGRKIHRTLKDVGAYHNGYLLYCYHSINGGDLVVERLRSTDLKME